MQIIGFNTGGVASDVFLSSVATATGPSYTGFVFSPATASAALSDHPRNLGAIIPYIPSGTSAGLAFTGAVLYSNQYLGNGALYASQFTITSVANPGVTPPTVSWGPSQNVNLGLTGAGGPRILPVPGSSYGVFSYTPNGSAPVGSTYAVGALNLHTLNVVAMASTSIAVPTGASSSLAGRPSTFDLMYVQTVGPL